MIQVVFENEHFIACDKPSGVLSVPDRFASDRPCLGLKLQKNKKLQIFPVHRLDFEVSGLILYAKNSIAHKASQQWFSDKALQKKYLALTSLQNFDHWPSHVPAQRDQLILKPGQQFDWQMKILRGKKRSFESPQGDLAITVAKLRGESTIDDRGSEMKILSWEMYPITGRSHQLRLELSRHGFPILGDQLYGSRHVLTPKQWPYGSIALRAVEVSFYTDSDHAEAFKKWGLPSKISL